VHIHQITLDNFKSFAVRTVIPFEDGFTTISGPNGSGKSNIIDGILFCLGLSTSRAMRAEKLSDLINNLSKRKEATVEITFRKSVEDRQKTVSASQLNLGLNEEGETETLPTQNFDTGHKENASLLSNGDGGLETSDDRSQLDLSDEGEFVQVSRRIRGNNSGYVSTYYLNNRPATLTAIHEYLGNFNVSPGTYNVMMQGDVAGIVNMSAIERRKIIDEIAGVAEFDRKIEQAQHELEATGANIERNTILLNEIRERLGQLSQERDHALKYQALREEKNQFEGLRLTAKYVELKKAIAASMQNLAEARVKKEAVQAGIQGLLAEITTTHAQLLEISNQVKKKGEDQQIALKKQIESLKGHIARKEDAISGFDAKTAENQQRIRQAQQEIERMGENSAHLDEEIANFLHQLKELQVLYETEAQAAQQLETQFEALTDSSGELSLKRNDARRRLTEAEDEKSRQQRAKLDGEAELQRLHFEIDMRQRGDEEKAGKRDVLRESQRTLTAQTTELSKEREAYEAQIGQLQKDAGQARADLTQAQADAAGLQREYVRLEARQRAYEEVNFTRAVDTILRSNLPGVHGTVAQLGDVNADYGLAMEIALGGRIQNIVVDDDNVASEGIRRLQESRAGRATFLPLNKIQKSRPLPPLPRESGVIDYAFNLIDCRPEYDDVFAYALGETLIVEDAQAARKLLRRYRMVTLDGSLMEKSGAMTGGSQPNRGKGGGFFGGNQVEQELQALAQRLENAEASGVSAQKKLTGIEVKLDGVKNEYIQLMQNVSRLSAELEGINRQLKDLEPTESEAQRADIGDLQERMDACQTELLTNDETLATCEQKIAALNEELAGIESHLPSEQIDHLRERMKEVKFQMDYYDTQMRNVQTDIKSKEMEKNYQQVGVQDSKLRIEQATTQNAGMVKERAEAAEEVKLTQRQIDALEAQTSELDEELKKLQGERDVVQAQLLELEKRKNIDERQIAQLEEQIAAFSARRRELEPQAALLATKLAEDGVDVTTIDESKLPSEDEIGRNIARLTQKMEKMEPVNMLAIDEFERVQNREAELADKINTLSQESESVSQKIASFHELKLSAFMTAYESVDQAFRGIFAELSDGNGELTLTRPDAPFEGGMTIHAQPRGKKMLRIEGLSGGEKSLTSLAFVFAIQRYMPAPFYALDEVDQNLDGINAEKLANMVEREARRAQFVVVSLRKPMIEASQRTIGVTQRQNGITKVTGIKHRSDEEESLIEDAETVPSKPKTFRKSTGGRKVAAAS
jgi:chromosome segregation protein